MIISEVRVDFCGAFLILYEHGELETFGFIEDICWLFFCFACIIDGFLIIFHAIIGQKDVYKVLNCGSEMVIFRKREAKV